MKELETWTMPGTDREMLVHSAALCIADTCVIHKPTDHLMRSYRLHWRDDRGIFERLCPHGTGHPDPDQYEFWRLTNQEWQSVHGCDGCCVSNKGSEV